MSKPRKVLFLPGYYVREHHLGLAHFAREAGWLLDASMAHFGRIPPDWHGDGIITMSADRTDIVDMIRRAGVPVVDLFNGSGLPDVPHVCIDNVAIGRMAGDYLVAQGFQEIGYFYYDPEVAYPINETERSAGLREVVEASGRRFHELLFHGGIRQIRKLSRPLALMVQNDLVGDWLMHRLLESNLRVPQDVAVIGVDSDRIYSEFSPVQQTVVASNIQYQGFAAAELLQQLMDGGAVPSGNVMIQPERVIERASTSLLVSENPVLNGALAFIRGHFGARIEVDDICRHVGLGRHQLDKLFKQFVGESASRHLLRVRLGRAKQLLAESDDKILSIATDLGFSSAAYFSTVFHQESGLGPAEFRRRAQIRTRTIYR